MGNTTHELKTWPEYFTPVMQGTKTFELRVNDRDFHAGDDLVLKEWLHEGGYTGNELMRRISYVLPVSEFDVDSTANLIVLATIPIPQEG